MSGTHGQEDHIIELFERSFSASESPEEGRLVAHLVRAMLASPADIQVFLALQNNTVHGTILFSPLIFPADPRKVTLLSPVAIAPEMQGRGIGQALLRFGLKAQRNLGCDMAFTYGSPRYYAKVGFVPIKENIAKAPHPLQHPEGWLAQSLKGYALKPFEGTSQCIPALDHPEYW